MVEQNLGEATIVYEDAEGETVEETVENEHLAYFQDHWMVKLGEDDQGRDLVRRVPAQRVYHVDRTVERFEEEVKTLRHQVQSVADDLRSKLLGGQSGGGSSGRRTEGKSESISIDVESGESSSDDGDGRDAS